MPPPPTPRAFRDDRIVEDRLTRLFEPHVAPLNRWVEDLRRRRGDGKDVPWFDPDGGGANAEALLLFEAPGRRAANAEPSGRIGSGIISPDNDDQTAANTFQLREEAGLDRHRLVHSNIIPWYIGTESAIRGATLRDLDEAAPFLAEFLRLVRYLKVVVLVGRSAQRGWDLASRGTRLTDVPVIRCPHPSPRNLNTSTTARAEILAAFREDWDVLAGCPARPKSP